MANIHYSLKCTVQNYSVELTSTREKLRLMPMMIGVNELMMKKKNEDKDEK